MSPAPGQPNRAFIVTRIVAVLLLGGLVGLTPLWYPLDGRSPAPGMLGVTPSDLSSALHRCGLEPEALAAAGISPAASGGVVANVRAHLDAAPTALSVADALHAQALIEHDRLERLIQSGRAPGGGTDLLAFQAARTQLNSAASKRQATLDGIFAAGVADLPPAQQTALTTIRANRGQWDQPLELLVVNKTEKERVAIREALANERISAKLGEPPDPQAKALLTQLRSEGPVAMARAHTAANVNAIQAAWSDAMKKE